MICAVCSATGLDKKSLTYILRVLIVHHSEKQLELKVESLRLWRSQGRVCGDCGVSEEQVPHPARNGLGIGGCSDKNQN